MVDFITPIIIVVILVALVAIVNAWVIGSADRSFFELMVKMPKFVDRPDATLADYEASFTPSEKPGMIETYQNLRLIAIFVMAGAFILGMILFLGEEFGVQRKGQAIELVANTLVYSLFLLVFPVLWDGIATGVEYLNVYILNPADPTPESAAARAKDLFIKLGGINTEFDMGKLLEGTGKALVGDQGGLTQFFHDMMTAVFRAFLAALIFLMMFIIGTIRIVLTAAIIVGLPMILAIKLVPWVRKPADRLLETLYGLVVATTLSSIVAVAGAAYLDTLSKDGVVENFQAFVAAAAVIILAVFIPVMLSPMLGSVVSSITGMVTSSLMAGAVAGSSAVMGAARGAAGALGYGGHALSSMGLAGGGLGPGGAAAAAAGAVAGAGLRSRIAHNAIQATGGASIGGMGRGRGMGQSMPEVVAAREERAMRGLPPSGHAPVVTPGPATGSAPSITPEPILSATSKPVVETPRWYRPDVSTLEDAAARTSAGKRNVLPALAIQPGSVVFTPEPTPLTTMQKLHLGAKGAMVGGVTGLAQGLGKGLAIESRGAGMADIGRAVTSTFGGRLDTGKEGLFDSDDVRKGVEKLKLKGLATRQVKKTLHETHVSQGGERRGEEMQDSFTRAQHELW